MDDLPDSEPAFSDDPEEYIRNRLAEEEQLDRARAAASSAEARLNKVSKYLTEEDLEWLLSVEPDDPTWELELFRRATQRKIEHDRAAAEWQLERERWNTLGRQALEIYHEQKRARSLRHDREYQSERRAERAAAPPDPLIAIDREYQLRLKRLRWVCGQRWRDKRVEQLRGREWEITPILESHADREARAAIRRERHSACRRVHGAHLPPRTDHASPSP
jgi:hypothetical protein